MELKGAKSETLDTNEYPLKLKCIDSSGTPLSYGKTYRGRYDCPESQYIDVEVSDYGRPSHGWLVSRFEILNSEPEVAQVTEYTQAVNEDENPSHYQRFAIEPLVFIEENNLPFWAGNVIKYVCRHDAKDGLRDLKKAREYLDKKIRRMEGVEDWCK